MSQSEGRYRRRVLRPMLVLAALTALAIVLVPSGAAKPPSPTGTYQACLIAGDGTGACTTTASGGDYSVLASGNPELQVTITNNSASNQTLDYANVNVPTNAGVGLSIDTAHSPQPASYATYASSSTSSRLQLRGLGLAPGASKTVAFFVNSTSPNCTDGNWTTEARSGSTPSAFVFSNPPTKSSGLTSLVSVNCGLSFQSGPTAALPNKTVTNAPYDALGTSVTVVTQSLPVPLNGGGVSLAKSGSFESGTDTFTGTGPVPFGSGSAAFGSLQATGTGGPFTLTASAAGFTPAVSSPPFAITKNGTPCDSGTSCALTGTDSNGKSLTQIMTSAGFGFVGTSPTEVPFNPTPAGCQPWTPTPGVSGFAEFDGRTAAGTMTITYYVPQNAIKARYGKNVGQQFIPICIGAKTIDPLTQAPQDCSTPGDAGWEGDQLDSTTGAFTGRPAAAVCGPGGYWWGIISSFQDKLDQSMNPVVTSWSSPTIGGTTYRAFVISVPSNLDMQGHG
jgi:hypothetical protein